MRTQSSFITGVESSARNSGDEKEIPELKVADEGILAHLCPALRPTRRFMFTTDVLAVALEGRYTIERLVGGDFFILVSKTDTGAVRSPLVVRLNWTSALGAQSADRKQQ